MRKRRHREEAKVTWLVSGKVGIQRMQDSREFTFHLVGELQGSGPQQSHHSTPDLQPASRQRATACRLTSAGFCFFPTMGSNLGVGPHAGVSSPSSSPVDTVLQPLASEQNGGFGLTWGRGARDEIKAI